MQKLKRRSSSRRTWKQSKRSKPSVKGDKTSPLEAEFALIWRALEGPVLEREYKFHPTRLWKFDFCHVAAMVAIELEGGVWIRGRHTSPSGFIKDCEKYNAATLLGWTIYRIPRDLLGISYIEEIKRRHFGTEPYHGKELKND